MIKLQSAVMDGGYEKALDYLYSFVNFEHRRLDQYSPENISLERVRSLLALLDNPHESFPSIHIAGTKGKGSVAAMCAFCLRASGLKTALYTSPHIQDFRDRIRILTADDEDGRIEERQVAGLVEQIKPAVDMVPDLTWYEIVTAIAFAHFRNEMVDIAVVEVGLGGRLDATNVLTPLVSVITSLSLDHTYLLGESLAEIAVEKGGIIKPDVPVVLAPQKEEALVPLREMALALGAPTVLIGRDWQWKAENEVLHYGQSLDHWKQRLVITKAPEDAFIPPDSQFVLPLAGKHQQENAMVALAALDAISSAIPGLTLQTARAGLAAVQWPGRMQLLVHEDGQPAVLVDCAHNVDSAKKLVEAIHLTISHEKLVLIIGTTADKDVRGILMALLPGADFILMTSSGHPRANTPGELLAMSHELGFEAQAFKDVKEAMIAAWKLAGARDLICVTGSIFLVGDLLNQWEGLKSRLAN